MELPALIARSLGTDRPAFLYDRRARRYRDARTGRFVRWERVRSWLDAFIDSSGDALRADGQRLIDGTLPIEAFQQRAEARIKAMHLAAFAVQRGGLDQLRPADLRRISRMLYDPAQADGPAPGEFWLLNRMVGQIERGE